MIIRADGFPPYHLAILVDDPLMGITHVVRGEELLPSTPRQIPLYAALVARHRPSRCRAFAHMPLCCGDGDKSKISKRKNPAAPLTGSASEGYLPEALLNFLALLG